MLRSALRLETLDRRDVPAVFHTFAAGQLNISFDNAPAPNANPYSEQATTISSYEGVVTLTYSGEERQIHDVQGRPILASQVRSIAIEGSNQPNFIDLHLVDSSRGFRSSLKDFISMRGRGGDDVLIGSQFADRIRGGDGADQIYAGAGDDWLAGDAGDDWLDGGFGNNVYQGGSGRDWFARFQPGDRVVDFEIVDFYDPIGVPPAKIGIDETLRILLRKFNWNLNDEP